MGVNGPAPKYERFVSAEELIERITYMERIWKVRQTGSSEWTVMLTEYQRKYHPLFETWRPSPPPPSRR